MTTRRRITTAVFVSLGFAMSASPALAQPTNLTPNGSEVTAGSLSVRSHPAASASQPTIVRVSSYDSGFEWGDAGIGAAGGFVLSLIGIGGALAISRSHSHRSAA